MRVGVSKGSVAWFIVLLLGGMVGCSPTVQQVLPTARPTLTLTTTIRPSGAVGVGMATPTTPSTRPPMTATGGPSPTALLGSTSNPDQSSTATYRANPDAARIEFFTANAPAVFPGGDVTLYWSSRGASSATIYRLDAQGERNQLWNVQTDGNLKINTRTTDRGVLEFVLNVGEGANRAEQRLVIPLTCPINWFFAPAPAECPNSEPVEVELIEQPFERGRMIYVGNSNEVFALHNDGAQPAWVVFQNRYNADIDPEKDATFPEPVGYFQPRGILGWVWRDRDITRSRLGLGTEEETPYSGFVQTDRVEESEALYISSRDGTVLKLLPNGEAWQIIALDGD